MVDWNNVPFLKIIIIDYWLEEYWQQKEVKMIAPYFPAILVPIIGIFLPGIAMATLFVYIEKESVE